MTQQTPAQLRATAEAALVDPGAERTRLLDELEAVEVRIRPLVVEAVRMEVPYRRINELTAVAPNTAIKWRREADTA